MSGPFDDTNDNGLVKYVIDHAVWCPAEAIRFQNGTCCARRSHTACGATKPCWTWICSASATTAAAFSIGRPSVATGATSAASIWWSVDGEDLRNVR